MKKLEEHMKQWGNLSDNAPDWDIVWEVYAWMDKNILHPIQAEKELLQRELDLAEYNIQGLLEAISIMEHQANFTQEIIENQKRPEQ